MLITFLGPWAWLCAARLPIRIPSGVHGDIPCVGQAVHNVSIVRRLTRQYHQSQSAQGKTAACHLQQELLVSKSSMSIDADVSRPFSKSSTARIGVHELLGSSPPLPECPFDILSIFMRKAYLFQRIQ